jgi:drug/metabolite transporter (DMT)-like permease
MSAALIGHMLVLLPLIVWVQPDKLMPESASDWLWISALGLLSAAIPQYLFARGSVQAGVESTTSIGSTEVIFAMALSAVFLGDDLTRAQYLAAALIVMSSLIRLEETGTDRKSDGSNKSILGSR